MTDREKVIAELNRVADEANPWKESPPLRCDISYPLLIDTIALLKAQEPVTVIPAIKGNDELLTKGCCPICGAKLDYYLNGQFCGCCGKAVKWE